MDHSISGVQWTLYFCGDCEKAIRKINMSTFNARLMFYVEDSDEALYLEGYPGPRLPKRKFGFKKSDILLIKEVDKFME